MADEESQRSAAERREYWAQVHIRGDRSKPVVLGSLGGGRRVARGGGTRRERGGHKFEEQE